MRKLTELLLTAIILVCTFTGCKDTVTYKVTVDKEHTSICEVGKSYSEGEEVVVRLETVTEHYYSLYVNGVEQQMDHSDMEFSYFVFTMPNCDVDIKIEDHNVDIPNRPQTNS